MLSRPRFLLALAVTLATALLVAPSTFVHPVHAGSEPVRGPVGPAPVGGFTLYTDQSYYSVCDTITVCYTLPGYGYMRAVDSRTGSTIASWEDDGTPYCFDTTASSPAGRHCIRMTYTSSYSTSRQTCFIIGY